jgi:hypothetical protein
VTFDEALRTVEAETGITDLGAGPRVLGILERLWEGGHPGYARLDAHRDLEQRVTDEIKRLDERIDKIRSAGAAAHLDNPAYWDAVLQAKREGLKPDPLQAPKCFWAACMEYTLPGKTYCAKHRLQYESGPLEPKPGNGPWLDHKDPRLVQLQAREEACRALLLDLVSQNHYSGPLVERAKSLLGPMAFCAKCSKHLREGIVTTITAGGKREHVTGSPECSRA